MAFRDKDKARDYQREWQKDWRQTEAGKAHVRKNNLAKYGITPEDYDILFEQQGGVCAACGQPETHKNQYGVCRLAVDHDHETGEVRGLLCGRCNRALGLLNDELARVQALAAYRGRFT